MLSCFRATAALLTTFLLLCLSSTAHAGSPSVLTFTKAFGVASIAVNGSTSLTFSLALNNVGGGGGTGALGFTDALPAGLVVSTPSGLSAVTCSGGSTTGTVTATAGTGTIGLAGMNILMNGNCSFSVNVTGTTAGVKNNSVTTTAAYIVGGAKTATASLTVTAAPDPSPPIPALGALPSVSGIGIQPSVLNLSAGDGPTMLACLIGTVRTLLGSDAAYLGQTANGGARISQGGKIVTIYPLKASSNGSQSGDISLGSSNTLNITTSCGNFDIAPAVYNLPELGAVLNGMGLVANINAQGVMTLTSGNTVYVVRPDYFATPGKPGTPSLTLGTDGLYRFTDSAGSVQIMRPAFLDTDALSAQVGLAWGGWVSIQIDGTALFTPFSGPALVLTADFTLSSASAANAGKLWWQDSANHYSFRGNNLLLAQGFTSRLR